MIGYRGIDAAVSEKQAAVLEKQAAVSEKKQAAVSEKQAAVSRFRYRPNDNINHGDRVLVGSCVGSLTHAVIAAHDPRH